MIFRLIVCHEALPLVSDCSMTLYEDIVDLLLFLVGGDGFKVKVVFELLKIIPACISNDFGCRLQLLSMILSLNCKSKLKLIQSQSPRIYKTSVEEYISCYATTAIT